MPTKKSACSRALWWEFHISRVCLTHHNWKAFAYTPWLPDTVYFQWIYVLYRWVLALYFVFYFFWMFTQQDEPEFRLIYLSNWGLIFLNVYLIWSCIYVTVQYFVNFMSCCVKYRRDDSVNMIASVKIAPKPRGCCGQGHNSLKWYEIIYWILFTITGELAVLIAVLYWGLLYNSATHQIDHGGIAIHLINAIVAVLDIWVTRVPIRLYHMIYTAIIAVAYDSFSGIYYAAGGGNDYNNASYIYPVIDYEKSPVSSAALVLLFSFVLYPLIHCVFYINYLMREGLFYIFIYKFGFCSWLNEGEDDPVKQEKYSRKGSQSVELIS